MLNVIFLSDYSAITIYVFKLINLIYADFIFLILSMTLSFSLMFPNGGFRVVIFLHNMEICRLTDLSLYVMVNVLSLEACVQFISVNRLHCCTKADLL